MSTNPAETDHRTRTDHRIQTICLLVLTTVVAAAALRWLAPVMVPFVLSLFIAVALAGVVDFLVVRLSCPRVLAIPATLLLTLLLFGIGAALTSSSVAQLAANAGTYQAKIARLAETASASLPLERFGIERDAVLEPLKKIPASAIGSALVSTTNAVANVLSQSFLVLIFVIYLLVGGIGRGTAPGTWGEIEQRVKRFLVTKALVSAATGFLVSLTLTLLGVDLAMMFGLLAFMLNFVPSVGSIIATLLPLPVVLLSPDLSPFAAVLAIAIPGALQVTIGNVVEPKVMGDSLDLHPITILMALIFWGMLWGVLGMLLATPITAVMKILFEKLEHTQPLARLMAGRLALVSDAVAAGPSGASGPTGEEARAEG